MRSINALDIIVIVAYLAGTTLLGIWVGRKQKDAKDYFVADRSIPWWAVMFSVVASETSALTFISIPGLAYGGNLGFLQVVAGYILGRIVVAYTLLPRYYNGNLVTAYALLEQRFGLATRRFTSIVFMVTRGLADAVRVFATAIPIALILNGVLPRQYVMPTAVLILGTLTIIYTYKGGMRAVVWTEILQACVYLLGGISAAVLLGRAMGGWGTIIERAGAAGKLDVVNPAFVFNDPHTLFAGLIGGAFLAMASHGADQLIVQRLLSSRSLKDARMAIIGSGFVVFAQFTLFLMVGMGLWTFFEGRAFPAGPDSIFPTFIIDEMPHGLVGLLLAAILAATMSTHSGAINALAASSTHDIYLPLTGRSADDPRTLKVGKTFALIWGVVLTGGALFFPDNPQTPVVVIALSIASFTYGALLGAFFLGILWERARQRDAILAMSVAIISMALIVFAKRLIGVFPWLEPVKDIAWPWYVLIGTSITMTVGVISSFFGPARRAEAAPPAA